MSEAARVVVVQLSAVAGSASSP
ncbi:hypothetical protein A2U01_0108693, partial [Trifolium medium]|nr:hypothetical protein [Trifolium medium]